MLLFSLNSDVRCSGHTESAEEGRGGSECGVPDSISQEGLGASSGIDRLNSSESRPVLGAPLKGKAIHSLVRNGTIDQESAINRMR